MNPDIPVCPECGSEHTYELDGFQVCSMRADEWNPAAQPEGSGSEGPVIRDAVGNVLEDGDTVVVTKNLKVKKA